MAGPSATLNVACPPTFSPSVLLYGEIAYRPRLANMICTFVMDYKGRTYISQVREKPPRRALRKWAQQLDTSPITGMGPKAKAQLITDLGQSDNAPTPLTGVLNVWCASSFVRGGVAQINMIQTDEDPVG